MFKEVHYYKPNLEEVIQRYKDLYSATSPGHAIIYAMPPFPAGEPIPPLNTLNLDVEVENYLDICMRNYRSYLEITRHIPDDLLPTFGLNFGIGDYSAFIEGEVVFTEDTSWAAPVMKTLADMDLFVLDPENYWVRMLERSFHHMVKQTRSGPIALVRGYYSPLDLAHALRGEALFTDFADSPEQVHQLMAFCARAVVWMANRIRSIHGLIWGGNVAGAWLKPNTICMSEDIACLVSPRTYATFARPYTQYVIDSIGYGQIHTHSLGIRTIPEITRLNNLLGLQISDDPNTEPGFTQLDWLLPRSNQIPLTVGCTPEQVYQNAEKILKEYNITFAATVSDIQEGQKLVEWVRKRSL